MNYNNSVNNTQYFIVTIDIKNDISDEDYLKEGWLKLLENIYGTKSNNYELSNSKKEKD